jgi:hypothetical protein
LLHVGEHGLQYVCICNICNVICKQHVMLSIKVF